MAGRGLHVLILIQPELVNPKRTWAGKLNLDLRLPFISTRWK